MPHHALSTTATQLVSALDSVPGAYIVQLDESVTDVSAKAEALLESVGGVRRRTFDRVLKGFSVDSLSPAAVVSLRRAPGVRLVEPVRLLHPAVTQVLPFENGAYRYSGLWNLDRVDELGNPAFDGIFSFDYSGSGSHIYIVDSGVRGGHVEFTGRLGNGAAFIKWSSNPSPTIDQIGHGTAVASVAAGTTYGVAKGATIHPVRIDDGVAGAYCDDVVAGLNWVRANVQRPAVVNLSYGSIPNCFSVRDAIDGLLNADIQVFKAAGNEADSAWKDRGNRAVRSVIVGATTAIDTRASTSNYGTTLTLFAPGEFVRAASGSSNVDSVLVSGTSVAAPLAAGVAASALQHYPLASALTLKSLITTNATSTIVIGNGNGSPNLILYSRIP